MGRALSARQFYWLVAPAAAMVLGLYFFPLAKVLWISVTEPRAGLDNYALLFSSESVQRVLLVPARLSTITTGLTLLLGYVVAYARVHTRARHLRWITFFVLLPLWISVLVPPQNSSPGSFVEEVRLAGGPRQVPPRGPTDDHGV